jgi:hypothetical protein
MLIAPVAESWFGGGLEPSIKELAERDGDSLHPSAQIPFSQHLIKEGLSLPDGTVHRAIEVAPFAGSLVATEEYADEPAVPTTADDLSRFASQRNFPPENLAHRWHTAGAGDTSRSTT